MEKNAEMVIMRHRALFAKPGDLKELVSLPIKRRSLKSLEAVVQESLLDLPLAQMAEIVILLKELISGKTLSKN